MQEWIITTMEQSGYLAIALLITIENLFPPIPSEIVLTFGGFITTYTSLSVIGVIIASTIGALVGASILYAVGRFFDKQRLERIISGKIGKILKLDAEDIGKAFKWFEKHGKRTVFFCRFVPIIRSLISVPAGMAKMKFGIFMVLSAIGSLIWNSVLVVLGVIAGESWQKIAGYMDIYSKIGLIVICAAVLIFAYVFIKKRLEKKI